MLLCDNCNGGSIYSASSWNSFKFLSTFGIIHHVFLQHLDFYLDHATFFLAQGWGDTWEFHFSLLLCIVYICACIFFWLISFYLWLVVVFLFSWVYYRFTPLGHRTSRHYTSRHDITCHDTIGNSWRNRWWSFFIQNHSLQNLGCKVFVAHNAQGCSLILSSLWQMSTNGECHNLSLGCTTKAKTWKGASQKWTHEPHSHSQKCGEIKPHTPKWAPILGVEVLMDS
jgi:hypothetical protein